MREILADVSQWLADGRAVALATVIRTWGSSPRPAGASMAISERGDIAGSVSGGCVEGAVVEAALEVLNKGTSRHLHFGVADETAWEVGLACGGEIEVIVRPLDGDFFDAVRGLFAGSRPFAVLTRLGPDGTLPDPGEIIYAGKGQVHRFHEETIALNMLDLADERLEAGAPGIITVGGAACFVNVHLPAPTLVVVGGVHITIALVSLAKTLGYRTVVIDPRRVFGSEERFAHADSLVQRWPDEALREIAVNRSTAVAVVTHDPKLDDPALIAALSSDAFYVGALGSRKTQQARRERLKQAGLTDAQLDRLHGPIGLDLGGRSPEEIALAILAEVVQTRSRVSSTGSPSSG